MTSITDNITYLNFSKFAEFNESLPVPEFTDFATIMTDIYAVFVTYDIIQWFLSVTVFIALFVMLRKETFLNLTDIQVLTLSCLVVVAFNALALFMEIFSIIQPIQFFFLLWLGGVLFILGKKSF